MASVAYSRTNVQIRTAQFSLFIARKSNVFSLLGNGGSHEGTWNCTIYLSTDISSRHGSSREWIKCRTSHWLRVSHCMSAAANPLNIFPFAAKPQVPNWLEIGPTADGGHVDLTLVVTTSALNANDVCLLFLLHYTCHVSITYKYAPKIPHLFYPSFTCVTLSGPRLRLRFAIWPATSTSCTRLGTLKHGTWTSMPANVQCWESNRKLALHTV